MAQATPGSDHPKASPEAALSFLRRQMGPYGLLDSYVEDETDNSYTYDNALAAMAFLCAGDIDSTRKVLDAFHMIDPQPEGGFLECYHARTGKPNGILTAGPNAYLLQALNLYCVKTKDPRYNTLARKIADYLLSLQDKNGGLFGRTAVTWKSTENNLGAYCAIHNLGVVQKKRAYVKKAEKIHHFLLTECWDGTRFVRGEKDPTVVTDVQALGAIVLGTDYAKGAYWAEEQTRVTVNYRENTQVTGFDFNADLDTIWAEGTLQEALAFLVTGDAAKSVYYKTEVEKLAHPSGALLLATNTGTTGIDWTLEPWQAVAPTAWYLFLSFKTNPLDLLTKQITRSSSEHAH